MIFPHARALPIVDRLTERFAAKTDWLAALESIREDLVALRQRPIVNALLKFWLDQVGEDHAQLTPHFQQRKPELDLLQRVYVELQLSPERKRSAEPPALATPKELRDILRLDPAAEPWVTHRWVVLGDPGSGKTTLLRHFAGSLAREESPAWVPLFDSLPRLLREPEFVLAAAGRRMDLLGHPGAQLIAFLDQLGQEGRLLLLLDGLDEVPREKRAEAEQLLRGLAVRWPATPLVVASRPIGYRRPGSDFRELTLLPLDRERRRAFLARWFGRATDTPDVARAERALTVLEGPELRELAGNPLYLTLMALLFERGEAPERNRTKLYDQVFQLLLHGRHRLPETPIDHSQAVRQALAYLGLSMTVDNRDAEPLEQLQARLSEPAASAVLAPLERVARWRQSLQPFFADVAEKTGILGPHDGKDADWRFWHRTFREALAAERLAADGRGKKGRTALLARARKITADEDLSHWAEPFALLAGRVDDPDGLVRALVQANRRLGLRALATAQSLRDETVREVLALTENREERRKVYEWVPELVGEPGRALRLLDQLRRLTRDGNDLFFLDQAVQEVGRRSREQAREAAELRARLYDHIPVPPEELFRWIETPLDGRVEIWREVPAGEFWMGSPEGEGDEPRHKVTIARPFRYAAVPVTRAQYAAFDPGHRSESWKDVPPAELAFHPVTGVTWYAAVSFCRWLSTVFDWTRGARLPVEEEWEYACRAGTQGRYWSGDEETDLARVGWYDANSGDRTHRVGEKPANRWGLYDVHGNVWEWTLSPWSSYSGRKGGTVHDPSTVEIAAAKAPGGGGRVFRGGCYWLDAVWARAAYRDDWNPRIGGVYHGFRVALPLPAPSC